MSSGNGTHFRQSAVIAAGAEGVPATAGPGQPPGQQEHPASATPWFATKRWGVALCAFYPIVAVGPLVGLRGFAHDLDHSPATDLGINCALVGFTLLCMQFVLTARLRWLEAPFGLDVVMRFHRTMALVIVALLCAHPLLIAGDQSWHLLTRFHARWQVWLGRGALILVLTQVVAALFRASVRLTYERWRQLHIGLAVTILGLGFTHALAIGHDLDAMAALILWSVAPMLALAALLYSRLLRPRLLSRRPFRVRSVTPEAPRAWTVTLEAPQGRPLDFLPGQFQFLRFLDANLPVQEHPFTIASSPTVTNGIQLTIKACGDFTSLIDRLQPGDRATVHGPFGRFCHDLHPDERHLVFVAGGVGITPFMSMLRSMCDRRESRHVMLIHACRRLEDMLFASELAAIQSSACPHLEVIPVLSQPPPWWTGQSGRVDAGRLEQWCGGLDDKAFYVCCPGAMNKSLIRGLRRRNVSPRRIHCDHFSL